MLSRFRETDFNYMQNRELSWLQFNERVLDEATDPTVPLLERLKYISIFTSNLDEFFMIRVGSLHDIAMLDPDFRDSKSGLSAKDQLEAIYSEVRPLYTKKDKIYKDLMGCLKTNDIVSYDYSELVDTDKKFIKEYFKSLIKPILSPQIVDAHRPFPHINNKELYIFALLKSKEGSQLGILQVPLSLPEFIQLPGRPGHFIRVEKIIFEFADEVFGKLSVLEKNCLCITRNADISADDESFDLSEDYRSHMKKLLKKRNKMAIVRLEASSPMSDAMRQELSHHFKVKKDQIYLTNTPLKMAFVYDFASKLPENLSRPLSFEPYLPVKATAIDPQKSVIQQIKQKDVLVYHPYESMGTFLQLIKEASQNEHVVSIKITIYRLAKKAKLVDYLCAAAENGKEVTVIVELRARFDEQNNIDWSEKLEDAGCRVIYGFDEYKVHSKICLITYKERNSVQYITQIGTGNYNEKTSEIYTDLSIMTSNVEIGKDADEFFKNMCMGELKGEYANLLVAPHSFKQKLLLLMDQEILKGSKGAITMKLNSLTDIDVIHKLSEASQAGVEVRLIIRGICCLLPGVPGKTDKVSVTSIVGRYLEHSRIYAFGKESEQRIYIASADLMTRNTERRVEVACPVLDPEIKQRLNHILEVYFYDNLKARQLNREGHYSHIQGNRMPLSAQAFFCDEYAKAAIPKARAENPILHRIKQLFKK